MSEEYEPVGLVRGTLRIVGSALAAVLLVLLVSSVSLWVREPRTAVNEFEVSEISQVAIRSTNSDLTIVEGTTDRIVVRATVIDGLASTNYELHRTGDEIEVVGRCLRWLSLGTCGARVTVAVPKDYPLLIATGSADVRAEGLTDRVVTIGTGSGDVEGVMLQVQEFSVDSDRGDVSAIFAKAPYALKVTTKDGDIRARIPKGKIGYLVNVASETGTVDSNLVDQRDGRGIIRLLSDSGDINVAQAR
jgi:DUF4097 and DUF4098 domain-containing protein YvlB